MKISAVVPVFNTNPKYVQQCLDSIYGQFYKPHEIIVVNDGSTREETLAFLKELKEGGKVRVIDQENKKISGALNTGIRNMTGDWWAGLSSDDMWYPNKLKDQVEYQKQHPEAEVIYANWDMIDGDGNVVRRINEPQFANLYQQQKHLIKGYFP